MGVAALHAKVDSEPVVVTNAHRRVVQPLEWLPVPIVDPRREGVGDVLPPVDVVAGAEEEVGPLVGPDQPARRVSVECRSWA